MSLLESVRVPDPERRMGEYPHQLSGGSAPAGVHRGRAGLRSAAPPRRRAHHRARRHRAGAGARRARGAAARAVHGAAARHPRPRRGRRPRRRGDRDVRGPGRREGVDRHAVQRHEDALHRGAAALDPEDRASRATRASPRSPAGRPTSSTRRRAAGSRLAARTCRTAAARSSRRCARASCRVTSSAAGSRWARPRAPKRWPATRPPASRRTGATLMAGTGTAHLRPESDVLLRVEDLVVEFRAEGGKVKAVSGISLDLVAGRDARPRRRVGVRQVDDRPRGHAAPPPHVGHGPLRRHRAHRAEGQRAARDATAAADDLPGPDLVAQPAPQGRRHRRRGPRDLELRRRGVAHGEGRRAARARSASIPTPPATGDRTSSPVASASASRSHER